MNRKDFTNPYVTDSTHKRITNPQTMYETIKRHFNDHFYDTNMTEVEQFTGDARPLEHPITADEVQQAAKKLNNNRASGIDGMSAELIKYAPRAVHKQISSILNQSLQRHEPINLGSGILAKPRDQ